jgi:hypothetical protein
LAESGGLWLADQAIRTRRRCPRRSARRSSSERPPQTPASCAVSSAHCRQGSRTGHSVQMALAASTWASAGPVVPTGKNSSGSTSRQRARWRQSIYSLAFLRLRLRNPSRSRPDTNRAISHLPCATRRSLGDVDVNWKDFGAKILDGTPRGPLAEHPDGPCGAHRDLSWTNVAGQRGAWDVWGRATRTG